MGDLVAGGRGGGAAVYTARRRSEGGGRVLTGLAVRGRPKGRWRCGAAARGTKVEGGRLAGPSSGGGGAWL